SDRCSGNGKSHSKNANGRANAALGRILGPQPESVNSFPLRYVTGSERGRLGHAPRSTRRQQGKGRR
ncbi:MAG TPA: hypothetical protein VHQ95_02720, partial [Pyrinomonadaceae bacterium]|nr:hypothetical protein [Pyrinomonadaceae bacterium]